MSQIVVAQNANGIVLAAENRGIQLNDEGKEISLQVNRLLPLTSHSALLVAGAPEGVEMGAALRLFLRDEGLNDVAEIYGATLAFLSTEYERFMRKKCELLPIDPIHKSLLSWLEGRKETRPCLFASIFSGQRRNFPGSTVMRSPMPFHCRDRWAWNFS